MVRCLLILMFTWFGWNSVLGQEYVIPDSLITSDELYDVSLTNYVLINNSVGPNRSIQELRADSLSGFHKYSHPLTSSEFWLNIVLNGNSAPDQHYLVRLNQGFDFVTTYQFKPGNSSPIVGYAGRELAAKERSLIYFNQNYIALNLRDSERVELWLKVKRSSDAPAALELALKPGEKLEDYFRFNDLYRAIFAAIFMVLALYNLLLYFTIREITYLHFSVMVIALGLHASLGFFFRVFSAHAVSELSVVVASLMVFGAVKFNDEFMRCKRHLPLWHKVFEVIAYISLSVAAVQGLNMIFAQNDSIDSLTSLVAALMALFLTVFSVLAGILTFRKGEKRGKHFLLINLPVFLGSMIYLAYWMGINVFEIFERTPNQVLIASMTFYGSVTLQVILFSIVVGYSIKGLEQEKLTIQKNINHDLAKKVKARTQTLNRANIQINKQKDHLKEINTVKDKLFSIISHDLRSPLNALSSVVQLMKSDALSKQDSAEMADKIGHTLEGTSQLLDNLLYWSKNQMNGIVAKPERVNLVELIDRNIELVEPALKSKGLIMERTVPDDAVAYADENMTDLILRNLLSNAIKFSFDEGNVAIKVSETSPQIKIEVSDTGTGISQAHQKELFNMDIAHTEAGTRNEKGTGLGLVLCKDFVKINGGEISLHSEEGKGTTVIFTLPRYSGPVGQ